MVNLKYSRLILLFFSLIQIELKAEDELIFKPLAGNIYESRLGAIFTDNDNKLRLDIGGNYDFYVCKKKPRFLWGLGAEFFTYTRLRSESNFKFPVETTDFYFGLNGTFKFDINNIPIESRLRLAHISTHLSDGYSEDGIFFKKPFVYSREFVDFCFSTRKWGLRPYLGGIFSFSFIPKDINTVIPQLGLEYSYQIIDNLEFIAAYDVKIDGFKNLDNEDQTYLPMNMIVAGLIYRTDNNRGIFFKVERYFGKNYYGQFYKLRDNYLGLGFEFIYH